MNFVVLNLGKEIECVSTRDIRTTAPECVFCIDVTSYYEFLSQSKEKVTKLI